MLRPVALTLIVTAALCITAAPALAGDPIDVKGSKHKSGPYSNADVVLQMEPGQIKSVWFKVKNRSGQNLKRIRFGDARKATKGAFGLTWFHRGENVTKDVRDDDYRFGLDKGKSTKLKARVKQKAPGGMLFEGEALKPNVGGDASLAAINAEA